jgi:hypothetical protein
VGIAEDTAGRIVEAAGVARKPEAVAVDTPEAVVAVDTAEAELACLDKPGQEHTAVSAAGIGQVPEQPQALVRLS